MHVVSCADEYFCVFLHGLAKERERGGEFNTYLMYIHVVDLIHILLLQLIKRYIFCTHHDGWSGDSSYKKRLIFLWDFPR